MRKDVDDTRRGTRVKSLLFTALLAGALGVAADPPGDDAPFAALAQASGWLNSPALNAGDLRGKVVLVDFWTYSCVNWLRTLPYLRAWSERYRDQGLVVLGVHSPEFGFERDSENVRRAQLALGVNYPIALDSDHAIWNAFDNRYWPAIYLVDGAGRIRFAHFGEGEYDRLDNAIRELLAERGAAPAAAATAVVASGAEVAADWPNLRSGENYLGRARTSNFASPERVRSSAAQTFSVPDRLALNRWALAGRWALQAEASVLESAPGRIVYRFHARDVNVVMGASQSDRPVRFRVLLDGRPPAGAHGVDIDALGGGVVREPRLYQLIRQPGSIVERSIEIEFLDDGVQAFSFTFG